MIFCSVSATATLGISFVLLIDWTNLTSVCLTTESQAGCIHVTEAEHLKVRCEWTFKVLKSRQIRMHNILKSQDLALLKHMF